MEPTKQIYLEHMDQLTCEAQVLENFEEKGMHVVVCNQTVFYPQGGGQQSDQGMMTSLDSKFKVDDVRHSDGMVKHYGTFESGTFPKGVNVFLTVDAPRRLLNSKLHTAGHLVDFAAYGTKPNWIPVKGYHFPDGPYVEYEGKVDPLETILLSSQFEKFIRKKIKEDLEVKAIFVHKNELANYCRHVPANLPNITNFRVVMIGDFGVPCGGTHVSSTKVLKKINIRKIKANGDTIRVSYDIKD